MTITPKRVATFIRLYETRFAIQLPETVAIEKMRALVALTAITYKPMSKNDQQLIRSRTETLKQ